MFLYGLEEVGEDGFCGIEGTEEVDVDDGFEGVRGELAERGEEIACCAAAVVVVSMGYGGWRGQGWVRT